ncbi:MAG: cell wall-binding repeat-containing protein [Lagierella massiliensis]|nr:cell wall-binding repeat-containing protein [Lagierella massiliensis]
MDKNTFKKLLSIFICLTLIISLDTMSLANKKTPILNKPTTTVYQMKSWAKKKNANKLFIDLAPLYYSISVERGVDPAVTYAQSAKETNYLKFGGVLDASYFNPCGLKNKKGGGDKDPSAHMRFSSWEEGITAQVDHLALYAGAKGYPRKDSPDPRHFDFIFGSAPNVEDLGTKWAPSPTYGNEIVVLMSELYDKPSFKITRLAGTNRLLTSSLINQAANINSNTAIIANGYSFPDSISASTLAGSLNAHLLLNSPGSVTNEINNMISKGVISKVYLVGGNPIPKYFINSLKDKGIEVNHLKGKTRYDTAVEVAKKTGTTSTIFLANGEKFPDALSIAPVVKKKNAKLLFTDGKTLNSEVSSFIKNATEVYIVGGNDSVSKEIENNIKRIKPSAKRLSGQNRYTTSANIANMFYKDSRFVNVASGKNYADALSGTTLANKLNSPILLTDVLAVPVELRDYLVKNKIDMVYILGGEKYLSTKVEDDIWNILKSK